MGKHEKKRNRPKWTWKNGRLYHPVEPNISLSIEEAYLMQQENDDIAEACEGVLKAYNEADKRNHENIIEALWKERMGL